MQAVGLFLKERRLEVRYVVIAELLFFGLFYLSTSHAMGGIETHVMGWLEAAAEIGVIGLFLMALVSNLVMIINIPYMLIALTFVLVNDSPEQVLAFTLATGLGSSLGKVVSYALAVRLASHFKSLEDNAISRWINTRIERQPRLGPLLVFLGAFTVLPLDAALMPLALIRYPARLVWLPLTVGKTLQSASLAVFTLYAFNFAGDGGAGMKVDLTFGIVLATLLMVAYQVEKAKTTRLVPQVA